MSLAVDTTKRNKKYVITYTLVGIACFVMFIVSILRYVYLNVLEPVPIFFYAMLVWILLLRCKPTYDVSVERKYLKIVKHDIWGKTKVFEIPYREIAAIFSYQPKLMVPFGRWHGAEVLMTAAKPMYAFTLKLPKKLWTLWLKKCRTALTCLKNWLILTCWLKRA